MNNWHTLSVKEVLKRLKTSEKGITKKEAQKRLGYYGHNELEKKVSFSILKMFFSQFNSFFVYLLIIAAFISLLMHHLLDFYAIMAIIILNAIIGFVQNYKAEKAIQNLKNLLQTNTKVIRDGVLYKIPIKELVPGDIIILHEGDKISGDARIIESHQLQCNEAILTGESIPVDKDAKMIKNDISITERVNMLYSGTIIVNGSGKAVVISTGMKTEFGKIASLVQDVEKEKTPLQVKLNDFGKKIGIAVLMFCIILAVIGIYLGMNKLDMFFTAISLAVAAVPEGLPAVITICLAIAIKRMHNQ